jgi:hypothetical protein
MASAIKQNGGIITVIARAHYAATPEQVEQLAHVAASGVHAGTAYLRVILAHMQSRLGRPRRGKQAEQLPVLEAIHAELYPSVLKGVGPDEMERAERNALATFARSMVTTVRRFIETGGDVRGLEVVTATKTGLRKATQPPAEAPADESRMQRGFRRAGEGVLRAAHRLARGDPNDARQRIEGLMDQLETLLAELPAESAQPDVGGQTTTIVAGRSGVGRASTTPAQLHRGA